MSNDLISEEVLCQKIDKIKVSSAEIVVHGTKEKPYYEIKYFDLSDNETHIGFSSYKLDVVFGYLEKYFDIVNKENKPENSQNHIIGDLISRKTIKSQIATIRDCWGTSPFVSSSDMKLYAKTFNVVLQTISDCRTAFDTEKVIKKLNAERNLMYRKDGTLMSARTTVSIDKAIEIVEKGGIE